LIELLVTVFFAALLPAMAVVPPAIAITRAKLDATFG
jgi:hypothetical protein